MKIKQNHIICGILTFIVTLSPTFAQVLQSQTQLGKDYGKQNQSDYVLNRQICQEVHDVMLEAVEEGIIREFDTEDTISRCLESLVNQKTLNS